MSYPVQLLPVAHSFQLPVLKRHCEILCSEKINLNNAVSIYQTSKVCTYSLPEHIHCFSIQLQSVDVICVLLCVVEQVSEAVELAVFCEGFFLQNMVNLLDCEQFEELLLGSDCRTALDPDALDGLQATLTSRLHSICGPCRA